MSRDFAVQVSLLSGIVLFCCASALAQPPPVAVQWVTDVVEAPGVDHRTFDSAALGHRVSYHVYLPEEYRAEPQRRFPVLYWLHGAGGFSGRAIRSISRHFGDAMRAELIPPTMVVFPHAPPMSLWVDSSDGSIPMETVLVDELLPQIDGSLRTIASREGRIIEGWSMGGYGALRLALKRPDLFCAASSVSGGPLQPEFTHAPRVDERRRLRVLQMVCGGDHGYFRRVSPWRLAEENSDAVRESLRLRLVIGEQDEMLDVTRDFHAHLADLGIPHSFITVPDAGHQPMRVLRALAADDGWAFYREALGSAGEAPTPAD